VETISIDAVVTWIFNAEMWLMLSTFSEIVLEFNELYLESLVFHAKIAQIL